MRPSLSALSRLDPRSARLLFTALASYLGRFGAGVAVLVTIPMARVALSPELFGVWMMLSALLGFFSFADLGIGNGLLNRVTAALARDDRAELRRVIAAGYACTGVVGLALVAAWAAWMHWSPNPAVVAGRLSAESVPPVEVACTLFVVLLAINVSAALAQKVQLGHQRGHWVGISQFAAALGMLAAVPLTLRLGGGLPSLILASLGIQVAVNLANTWLWFRRGDHEAAVRVDWRDMRTAGELLRSGGLFFVLQLAVAFAFQSDSIVISQTLGQRAYGDFAVVQKLFLLVSVILASGMTGLWPAIGDALARRDIAWAKRAVFRALAVAAVFAASCVLLLGLLMDWIMQQWLHLAAPPTLALVAVLGAWTVVDAMGSVGGMFMNGANALKPQALFAVLMAALAFVGKWWLTPLWGAPGAVFATLAAYCLICVPGQVYIFRRIFAA